jgi:hypothetical protein
MARPESRLMPVTPAHAIAAWPLRKMWRALPLSALVIATMSPDYEYFLRLAPVTRWAHTPKGLVLFCVPVSLIVWLCFRRLVRPALIELLPPGLAAAIGPPSASWLLATVAAAIGAVTHVLWDGFTHQGDWAVTTWPALRAVPFPAVLALPWYKLLQYGGSVVGVALLAAWAASWAWSQPDGSRAFAPGQAARTFRVVAVVLAISAACAVADARMGTHRRWDIELGRSAVGAMVGATIAVLAFSAIRATSRRGTAAAP